MRKPLNYRDLFSGIEVPVCLSDGSEVIPINLDNAATTPPLKYVEQFLYNHIMMYGSVGRGGQKSSYCTQAYEASRKEILDLVGVSHEDGYEVIYVKNTTEGINLLAYLLCGEKRKKVISTRMEHHANDLPWRQRANVIYIEVDSEGNLKIEEIEKKLIRGMGQIEYVTMTAASNVTGYINPIHEVARVVHTYGAKLIVDAAQLVAHRKISMKGNGPEEDIDFLVFSGHKAYAPFGSGAVIAKKECIEQGPPFLSGGGTVMSVLDDDVYYKETPYKDEAGTPNFLGVMALVSAVTVLRGIGYDAICEHEERLKQRLINGLNSIHRVELYGKAKDKERVGVVSFNIQGCHHKEVGMLLQNLRGIAVRTGCFCAQPYVMRLLHVSEEERYKYILNPKLPGPGMVRASLGLYNTEAEIDIFLEAVEYIAHSY